MIYKEIDIYAFCDEFANAGMLGRFTDTAMDIIFEFLESRTDDYELDVLGLCCDIREEHVDAVADMLELDYCAGVSVDQVTAALSKHTTVLGTTEDTVVFFTY
jgi:hypothetical protein